MAIWQRFEHLLHEFGLKLPPGDVRVHILNESAWRRRLHLVGWYRLPRAVKKLQVWEQPFDLELTGGELFRGEIVVLNVETDGFLCDVLVVGIELRCKESRDTFYCCVYRRRHFLFNNNKHTLLID